MVKPLVWHIQVENELSLEGVEKGFGAMPLSAVTEEAVMRWVTSVQQVYQTLYGGRIDEVRVGRLGEILGSTRLSVGPLPVDSRQCPIPAEALERFWVYERSGVRLEPEAVAVVVARGCPRAGLPRGRIQHGRTIYSAEKPALKVFGVAADETPWTEEAAVLLETNIDNMNPEIYGYLVEVLLETGARDVFFTPLTMKKTRPATQVSVLVTADRESDVLDRLFKETTTLGVRRMTLTTPMLKREIRTVHTPWGPVDIKVGYLGGEVRSVHPEYEQCRAIALRHGVPLQRILRVAEQTFREKELESGQ